MLEKETHKQLVLHSAYWYYVLHVGNHDASENTTTYSKKNEDNL